MAIKLVSFRRKTSDKRRLDLIDAGIQCLGQGGMTAFPIGRICMQAGVSRGLVNHHFTSKNELLICIYSSMTEYLIRTPGNDSALQQISRFIENSFDADSFDKSSLRAWLSIWGEVATNPALKSLHQDRYEIYKRQLASALTTIARANKLKIDATGIARQLIALIDGLWLEYCLHSEGFSLETAKKDCYRFLEVSTGLRLELPS